MPEANWACRRQPDRKKVPAVAIDFTLSDSQQELQKNARAFADDALAVIVLAARGEGLPEDQ